MRIGINKYRKTWGRNSGRASYEDYSEIAEFKELFMKTTEILQNLLEFIWRFHKEQKKPTAQPNSNPRRPWTLQGSRLIPEPE